jgi:hypothetical protein
MTYPPAMRFRNARWPAAVPPVAAGQGPAPGSSRLPAVPTRNYAIYLGNLLSILSIAFASFFAFFSGLPLKVSCAMPRQTRWCEPVW